MGRTGRGPCGGLKNIRDFFVLGRRLHRSPSPRGGSAKRGAMRRCLWRSEKPEKGAKMPPPVKDSGLCRAKDGGAAGPREGDKRNLCSAIERPPSPRRRFFSKRCHAAAAFGAQESRKRGRRKGKGGRGRCDRLQEAATKRPLPHGGKADFGAGRF